MTNGDTSRPDGPRWDDLMLVRALDESVRTYQEMHGLIVEPLPEEVSKPGAEGASLDHLRELNLQELATNEIALVVDATEEVVSEVDERELEELILAAHDGSAEEQEALFQSETTVMDYLEVTGGKSLNEAGVQQQHRKEVGTDRVSTLEAADASESLGHSPEQEPATAQEPSPEAEEYTVEQYYQWLEWQASQQGAAAQAETTPLATTVNHHHHHYYSAEASSDALQQHALGQNSANVVSGSDNAPGTTVRHNYPASDAMSKPPKEHTNLQAQPLLSQSQPTSQSQALQLPGIPGSNALPQNEDAHGTRIICFDPPNIGGFGFPDEFSQCLTAMPAYRNKSLEELRWEHYAGEGGPAGTDRGTMPKEDAARGRRGPSVRLGDRRGRPEGGDGAALTKEESGPPRQAVRGFVFPSAGEGAPAECEGVDGRRQQGEAAGSRDGSEAQHRLGVAGQTEALSDRVAEQPPAGSSAQGGLFGQRNTGPRFEGGLPRPSSILAGAGSGTPEGGALLEIDPVLQDLLSAYYWMGYQTARYLHSRSA